MCIDLGRTQHLWRLGGAVAEVLKTQTKASLMIVGIPDEDVPNELMRKYLATTEWMCLELY